MKKSVIGTSHEGNERQNHQEPWVHRIGPPLTAVSIFLIVALVLFIGVMALASSACTTQPATSTESDNFTVGESATLIVRSLNGRIQVEAGSDNIVTVRAELKDIRRIKYEAIKNGDEVIVTAEKTGDWWFPAGNTKADIYVTVPAHTALKLKTSNDQIEVQGTTGGGTLETSNGAIVLDDVKGDFDATTSNGAVEIDTIDGKASVRTSNGRVTLQQAKGEFNARTSNGAVSFSGEMTPGGSNRLVTSNGSVQVELTGTLSLSIDASTSNGEIRHPDVPILTTTAKTDHVIGTIGAGEAELYIETSNGDVTIK